MFRFQFTSDVDYINQNRQRNLSSHFRTWTTQIHGNDNHTAATKLIADAHKSKHLISLDNLFEPDDYRRSSAISDQTDHPAMPIVLIR